MRASAATKVIGSTKGSDVNGNSSSKAADKRRRGAGDGKLPDVEEEEVEAEPASEEAGRQQAPLVTRPTKGGGPRRRESKRIALKDCLRAFKPRRTRPTRLAPTWRSY